MVTTLIATTLLLSPEAGAASRTKANNANNLNLTTSWSGGVVPGSGDIALWDSTVTAANTVSLGGNLNFGQIQVTNPGGLVTINAGNTLTLSAVSGVGIDMSSATQDLAINCDITLGAAQTWNVGPGIPGNGVILNGNLNNGGNLLKLDCYEFLGNGVISGAGGLEITGHEVGLSSSNTYTGATEIHGFCTVFGTLANVNTASSIGKGSIAGSAADLVFGGGTLHVGGSTDRLFTIGNSNGLTATILSTSVGLDFTNPGAIAFGGSGARTLNLIGISSSTFAPILGDGPGGATSLVKDFPNTWTITGANTYSGGTSVLRGTLTVGGSGTLGASTGNLVVSSPEGATTILNLNVDQIVGSLQGTVESGASATINIGSGKTLTVNQTINTTYEGVIVSAGSLTKSGSGTLTLSGTNSYTGATTINAGTLLINGSTASASAVTVNNAGTLGGSGTVNGTVTVNNGGNLAPGNSPGILHTGALTLNGGSTFRVDLNGGSGPLGTGAGTLYDQAAVIGQIILGGNLAATIGMTPLNIGDKYFIALNDGSDAVSGTFGNAPGNVYNDGTDFFLVNYADNGDGGLTFNDISLTVTAVPEPGTWLGATLLSFALLARSARRGQRRA